MLRWLSRLFQSPRDAAEKQQGDVHALNRSDDPRGGVQSDEYRHATPVEIVEDAGVAMGGPGGAGPEDLSPDDRRARARSWRVVSLPIPATAPTAAAAPSSVHASPPPTGAAATTST